MLSSIPIRPRLARWRDWLPLAVLLVALASVFALGGDRGYFYREALDHNQMTGKNLAVAANMSPKHNFRLAAAMWRDEGGGFGYDLYGRFPIGGYALIKFAILPFGESLAAMLLAARVLMLLMYCGAAILAYLALARIAGSRWMALAAALFAFSGFYALYYADVVAGETAMDLFGVTLVFHGIVLFVQEGRFRQLLLKTCVALLMGWHVYALILPFALLGFGGEARALVRSAFADGGGGIRAALAALPALARSRFIALAAVAVLFGSAMLALNLANEYAVRGENRSIRNLSSVGAMMNRLGLSDYYETRPEAAWGAFLRRQLHRAGVSSAPYAAAGFAGAGYDSPPLDTSTSSAWWTAWGVAAAVLALASLALVPRRFRLPMACLVLTGFIWALAARGNAYKPSHAYEALFHVGLPLALWLAALIGARRLLEARLGGALAIGIAALAAAAFALSTLHAGRIRADEHTAKHAKEIMADMDAIRKIASEKSAIVSSAAWHAATSLYDRSRFPVEYYFSGSYAWKGSELDSRGGEAAWASAWRNTHTAERLERRGAGAEYAILRYRDGRLSLTPGNRHLFLYESGDLAELYESERRRLESSEPDARSEFDVYLEEGALRYLKSPCAPGDADALFFAHFLPPDPDYLRGEGNPIGFEGVNFPFAATDDKSDSAGVYFDDACLMTVNIPPYRPLAAIRTGQYVVGGARLWEAAIFPPPSAETLADYESAYQTVADGEPAARSGFDLHLDADGGTLSYLKQPCTEEDVRGRFFLSVHPADAGDLPAERQNAGHESLNFTFEPPRGVVFNGKCMATRQLPDYEIAKMETGQDAPDGGRLWKASIAPPPSAERIAAYERAYIDIADGEPAARSGGFDLHLDADGGTLSYLKQPCTEDDVRGRFWLSVHPADAGDLPENRRGIGHESLNFDFEPPHGAVFNGKCMATRQLPDYEIAKIETGQDADGGRAWSAVVEVGD